MISYQQFRALSFDAQLDELALNAVSLDIFTVKKGAEVALFALHDFYVELYVKRFTDEIIRISSFRSPEKLNGYLDQVNIEEIKSFLML